jgi:hypothetical protein
MAAAVADLHGFYPLYFLHQVSLVALTLAQVQSL